MKAALNLTLIFVISGLVGLAAATGGATYAGQPVLFWCAFMIFAIQWVAFVPAFLRQTERFYDLTGSLTYVASVLAALVLTGEYDPRSMLLAAMILIWAGRLGTFLFRRVHRDGGDGRFDDIKPNALRFLTAWTLQGMWVQLTSIAALAAITAGYEVPLGPIDGVGFAVWTAGFAIEVVADNQKSAFRSDPANRNRFISTGLWSWSRHPNYFGEILLWVGIAIMAVPTLEGMRWVALISPVFVFVLLTRISGVPILERRAGKKWGDDPEYRSYKSRTAILVPWPPRSP